MFFNLIVSKFENLQPIWVSSLSSLSFCEKVDYTLIRVCLLYVIIIEIDYRVTIRENLSLDTIVEDDFFLAILICALDLAIIAYHLLKNFGVGRSLIMIAWEELHVKVLFRFFIGMMLLLLLLLLGF